MSTLCYGTFSDHHILLTRCGADIERIESDRIYLGKNNLVFQHFHWSFVTELKISESAFNSRFPLNSKLLP